MRLIMLSLVLWLAGAFASPAMVETPFAPGQVWTLSDPAFSQSQVVIDKVEMWNNQPIVHISVLHVPLPSAADQPQQFTTIQHMPFAENALRASVATLVRADGEPLAAFHDGYQQWQAAHGGVFTITVAMALKSIIGTLPARAPPSSTSEKASGATN